MTYRMELLIGMLERFVSGEDRSAEFVDKIEGVVIEYFQDSELYEELSGPISMFSPGGGEIPIRRRHAP